MNVLRHVRRVFGATLVSLLIAGVGAAVPATAATRSVSVILQPRQAVAPGGTARYPFLIQTSGKVGAIGFAFTGAPPEARTSVDQLGANRYELSVAVPANTPPSSFTVNVRTISRAPSKTFTVYLDVTAPAVTPSPTTLPPPPVQPTVPSFGIRADNPELSVVSGQTVAFGFTVDRSLGYTGDVTFTASGLPLGVTSNFSPNPTRGGTVLYATPSATTPAGRYTVTIRAQSDPLNAKFTSVILSITSTPDFALVVPASINLPVGGTVSAPIGYRIVGTSAPVVTLGVTGLPVGVSYSFIPNPTFGDSSVAFSATSAVASGSYSITIVGVAGGVTRSYPMTLNVFTPVGGFGLSASPTSLTIARGSSSSYAVTLTPTGGFTGAVTYVASGLPVGVTIGTGGVAPNLTFTVSVPIGASVGKYPLTLTGSSGSLAASIALELNVV